jgi:hypothetical protein
VALGNHACTPPAAGTIACHSESPRPLEPETLGGQAHVTRNDPPPRISGMTTIVVDLQGRMLSFLAIPPQLDESPPATREPDASELFAAAGLDLRTFQRTKPAWTPLAATEFRAAWTGPLPGRPETPIRVEAAWWRDKPVYFQIVGPWNRPSRMQDATSGANRADQFIWLGATFVTAGDRFASGVAQPASGPRGPSGRNTAGRIHVCGYSCELAYRSSFRLSCGS